MTDNQTKFVAEQLRNVFSATIVVQAESTRKDGMAPLYLQLIHLRKKKKIALKIWWPPQFFHKEAQFLIPRYVGDLEVNDTNLVLGTIKARANEILLSYRMGKRVVSMDAFISDFLNYKSRDCFLFYAFTRNEELYFKGINSRRTYQRNITSLNNLKLFNGDDLLPMREVNVDMIRKFDNWMRRVKRFKHNTMTSVHKVIRWAINQALADDRNMYNPYKVFKIRFVPGERDALDVAELKLLQGMLNDKFLTEIERESLLKFVFSCYTGIRVSDSALIERRHIRQGALHLKMKKGERFGKELVIPLPRIAQELISDRYGLIFKPIPDQTVNKALKIIGARAGIEKRLTFHVSRDTFATIFITMGGDPPTLQNLMGHSDLKTTSIYIKTSENHKKNMMDNFDRLENK